MTLKETLKKLYSKAKELPVAYFLPSVIHQIKP